MAEKSIHSSDVMRKTNLLPIVAAQGRAVNNIKEGSL